MIEIVLGIPVSFVSGYGIARYVAGKNAGDHSRIPSVKIPVKDHVVHIHHWVYYGAAIIAFRGTLENHLYVLAFLIGVTIQGLMYEDFHRIVYRKEK